MKCCALLFAAIIVFIANSVKGDRRRIESNDILADTKVLSPVIFVPGDGGNQIDAKLNRKSTAHIFCQKTTKDFFNIWLNMELLVPLIIHCFIDNVKLNYDNVTRMTSNQEGVETRIPGWGSPEVVEWLDPSHASTGSYFRTIGNALVKLGYERGKSIRGAPYDFRKAPNENGQWFVDMKALVEETYLQNGNTSTTLIAHSMGAPMALLFLQRQSQSWKNKYISKILTLAGAWGGTAKAIKVFAIGDDLGSFALSGKVLREEQITSPSLAWLMPSKYFWKPGEVFVRTNSSVYTFSDLKRFFQDLDYMTGWDMYQDNLKYKDFTAPGVEIHCLFGYGVKTVESLFYRKSNDFSSSPEQIYGDGDGTINRRSLEGCMHWANQQSQTISMKAISGADHIGILANKDVIAYVENLFG